jgi:sulfoxide reductase heme-binding subunit YedZ
MATKGGLASSIINFDRKRLATHLSLVLLTIISYQLSYLYDPNFSVIEALTFGPGYLALILTAASLIIGPLWLLARRKNPVNINFRRDVGIWAGVTALIHVVFGFQLQFGGDILRYFFADGKPLTNLFGLSNDVGLLAILIMLALLVFSNDLSLRKLKGKRWKLIQRFNYLLFVLAALHTLGYQIYGERARIFILGAVALSALVMAVQAFGIYLYIRRQEQRLAQAGLTLATPAYVSGAEAGQLSLSRRRFLTLTGAAMLTTGVGGFVVGRAVLAHHDEDAPAEARPVETNTPGAPFDGNNTGSPFQGNEGNNNGTSPFERGGGRRGRFGDNQGGGGFQLPGNNGAPNSGNAGNGANPTTPNSGAITPASGSNANGTVLATLASLPVGQARTFTNPDTGENCVLVHESDGSVKAFSNVCTHRPYNLTYQGISQGLYCALHGVNFDAKTGAPKSRPATRTLKSYNVQVDGQGNIVYQHQ